MSEEVSFGYETVDADEKTRRVGAVFSSVAAKYDVMNDAMSGGMHRLWKDQFVRRVKPQPGEAILDMAGGTGDIAFRMAERGAAVTVADINQEMLDVGLERAVTRGIDTLVWSRQNAEQLAYPDRCFDAYTIAATPSIEALTPTICQAFERTPKNSRSHSTMAAGIAACSSRAFVAVVYCSPE